MFKECLKYNIVPFIIEDNLKLYYYRGLKEWNQEKGYLTDTCLAAQDKYKAYLDYFRIEYNEQGVISPVQLPWKGDRYVCKTVLAAGVESMFVIMQRYNRPRVIRMIEKERKRKA